MVQQNSEMFLLSFSKKNSALPPEDSETTVVAGHPKCQSTIQTYKQQFTVKMSSKEGDNYKKQSIVQLNNTRGSYLNQIEDFQIKMGQFNIVEKAANSRQQIEGEKPSESHEISQSYDMFTDQARYYLNSQIGSEMQKQHTNRNQNESNMLNPLVMPSLEMKNSTKGNITSTQTFRDTSKIVESKIFPMERGKT